MCRYVTLHFREKNIFFEHNAHPFEVLTLNFHSLKSDFINHNVSFNCDVTFFKNSEQISYDTNIISSKN